MGAFKAGVKLVIINKELENYDRYKKRIYKSIENGTRYSITDEELKADESELKELIARGLEKYYKLKAEDSERIELLSNGMFFDKTFFVEKDYTVKE
jgi:hypothetical protein